MSRFISKEKAHGLAKLLRGICWFVIFWIAYCTLLILMGKVQVTLYTQEGQFEFTMLSDINKGITDIRGIFTQISDSVSIYAYESGKIAPLTRIGLTLIGLVRTLPIIYVFLIANRFFANITADQVFVESNAILLLRCGLTKVIIAIVLPLLTSIIVTIINNFTDNSIAMSVPLSGSSLFTGIVLLVVAYVFRYGLYLQDEADHTL